LRCTPESACPEPNANEVLSSAPGRPKLTTAIWVSPGVGARSRARQVQEQERGACTRLASSQRRGCTLSPSERARQRSRNISPARASLRPPPRGYPQLEATLATARLSSTRSQAGSPPRIGEDHFRCRRTTRGPSLRWGSHAVKAAFWITWTGRWDDEVSA